MQVRGHVRERHIQPAGDYHLGRIAVLARAHERRVVDGAFYDLVRRRTAADDADVILDGRLTQTQVLTDEHAHPYPRYVESVQEGVRAFH